MHISAIISEYNPFHLGHYYHIKKTRALGATHVIAIMSGNFSQRGEPCISSKFSRAKAALLCGIDLVIELPTIWSTARAEKFALGGISIANALGCVNSLSFGSESGDIEFLKRVSANANSPEILNLTKNYLKSGITFAKARELAVKDSFGNEFSDILSHPNNALALEYINAIKNTGSKIETITVERKGAQHDSDKTHNNIASASYIRSLIFNGDENYQNFMPPNSVNILHEEISKGLAPSNIKLAERAILAKLRCITLNEIACLPDVSEGLENRIYENIKSSSSLEELYLGIKTKRYTLARIKRIILSAFLNINSKFPDNEIPYIRILGFNEKGREILNKAVLTSTLPIISKFSEIRSLGVNAQTLFSIESNASDLYGLTLPNIPNCGLEMESKVITLRGQ